MKTNIVFLIFFTVVSSGFSQTPHRYTFKDDSVKLERSGASAESIDRLYEFFTKGHWGGHVRNYTMLTDHFGKTFETQYANATGMKIHFNTANFHGFDIGIGGIFTFDVFSTDLGKRDEVANSYPGFELQLFDVTNPDNRYDLDRLDELYIRYRFKNSEFIAGRHEIETPLVNQADGRMKPYAFQGLSFKFNEIPRTQIFASYISHVSPRSTVEWYSLGESIGIYGQGRNPDGTPGDYHGFTQSYGLGILGLEHQLAKGLDAQIWGYHVQNVMNTAYGKLDYTIQLGEKWLLYSGVEGLIQSQSGSGGSKDESHSYVCQTDENRLVGANLGASYRGFDLSLNTLYLDDRGRFLFPREWGRENFYVTMPRNRIEGMGGGNMYDIRLARKFKNGLTAVVDYAVFDGPGPNNAELNKYAMPDYRQINFDVSYNFTGWLEGLKLHFLYVYKEALELAAPEDIYYQANFNHYNLIANINF
ncbi:MAG: OprD family outer membrane porin [Cryomorphaceae bacterium]|nr:OprD family porin [Flavobacteriales bacterium]